MPQPYDYFGLMGGAANIGGVIPSIQQTLLGNQSIQNNQNALNAAAREDEARKAMSDIVLGGGTQLPGTVGGYGGGTYDVVNGEIVQRTPVHREGDGLEGTPGKPGQTAFERLARANPQAAAQLQAQMQQRQALASYFQNPTAKGTFELLTQFPDLKDQIGKGWDVYSGAAKEAKLAAVADAYGFLRAGDAAGAVRVAREHMEADKAAGLDTNGYQELIDTIQTNPAAGKAIAGLMLAAGAGPEKFAEAYGRIGEEERADEVQPYKVAQEKATASIKGTEAQYAPAKAQSELQTAAEQRVRWAAQTANEQADLSLRRDGLDLDRDRLQSTIQLELEKLDRGGTQLDAGSRAEVNKAVGESVSSEALADRAKDLADRFAASDIGGYGWLSTAREALRGAYGGQDPVTGLRQEYQRIVNQQAVKNLPPGPASDKDIQLAKQGFPPPSASKEYVVSFLRGMEKMQREVARSYDRRANWIAANGSLSPARRDVDVGGVIVPAGTTFNEFNGNAVKRGRQGDVTPGIQSIITKYGTGGR